MNDKKKKLSKKGTIETPTYILHKNDVQEDVFRFAQNINRILNEAKVQKKQVIKTKSDGRSPVVKSIFDKKYANTNGMHPRDVRVLKQVRELNGKSSASVVPLSNTKIAQSVNRMIKEDTSLSTLQRVISEYSYNTNKGRHGRVSTTHPSNRPERLLVKSAKRDASRARHYAKGKESEAKSRQEYDQAKAERDYAKSQLTRIT